MEPNEFNNINNKIYTNNNNILLEIINDLQQWINYSKDNIIIKRLSDSIIKLNDIINENKKNTQLIINHISNLENTIVKKIEQLNNNNHNNKEIRYDNGDRYVGELINGIREGKGIMNGTNGIIYIGDLKNDKGEGKGIFYYNNGDIYEGDLRKGKREGKGIYYYNNGDRYEGDFRKDKKEGKGIMYYINDDREMGDFYNGLKKGKFVMFTKDKNVIINNYWIRYYQIKYFYLYFKFCSDIFFDFFFNKNIFNFLCLY